MDPQSLAFQPQSDVWRLSNDIRTFAEVQEDHAARLRSLERRQEEDARMKSVWGSSSPFPGVLSGTPHHGPSNPSAGADFASFDDDHSNNMVRSLQLDADDEPRRLGATSRANSVRFDESANQGQFSHHSRQSGEFIPRTPSGLSGLGGGHSMFERSGSHRSDGRQSSMGAHSVSRANSLGLEIGSLGHSPDETPSVSPGLFILGTVPSIIRCWMNTDFKHDTLLYAAVCTGSYRSFLDVRLVEKLGYIESIHQDIGGNRKVKLPVFLPEASLQQQTSRPSSPVPQLPSIRVDFNVIDHLEGTAAATPKAIQIFLGSDVLRCHNADILFSSNSMTLYDDERNKLCIPLVRPENEATFKSLYTTNSEMQAARLSRSTTSEKGAEAHTTLNGLSSERRPMVRADSSESRRTLDTDAAERSKSDHEERTAPSLRDSSVGSTAERRKPSLGQLNTTRTEPRDGHDQSSTVPSGSRTGSTTGIWGNWRRDGSVPQGGQGDWGNSSRASRPNREQGIKVLKPTRQVSRSSTAPVSASPTTGQSRFFDDGKRRPGTGTLSTASGSDSGESAQLRTSVSGEMSRSNAGAKENAAPSKPTRGANPIGGASAFSWLGSAQK